jgi:ribulose-phosphate 3-epimerase
MTNPVRIAPSILSADWLKLADQVTEVVEAGADWIHIDVMDGRFVPNLTFGAQMITTVKRITDVPLDVHLMVVEPENYIQPFADAGADLFSFHPEATTHVHRVLYAVKDAGMKAGIALNPATPMTVAEEVVDDLDLLLIMSVNPGYGGQSFIGSALKKIARARALLDGAGSDAYLQVDGGVSPKTITDVYQAGADTFVAGSAVFNAPSPADAVRGLRDLCVKDDEDE